MKQFSSHSITLFLIFSIILNVQSQTWDGGGSDNYWNNPANWIGGIPAPGDIAFIDEGYSVVIPMGYVADINKLFLGNNSSLNIESGATLICNNSLSDALSIKGNVLNFGTIEINNCDGHAIRLYINTANGMQYGIFQNYGTLKINDVGGDGVYGEQSEYWYNENQSKFYNFWNGIIEMENVSGSGINTNYFENQGRLKIVGQTGGYGILLDTEEEEFLNMECAKLLLQSEINVSDGNFINDGFIYHHFNGNNTTSSLGTFVNNGFIEDHYGSFKNVTFTNNGVWLPPLDPTYAPFEGDIIENITNGLLTDFEFSNVFSDHNLTMPAGTYSKTDDSWNTHLVDPTDTTFFMEITSIASLCKDTVNFVLKKPFQSVNYWIGGSGKWDVPGNWKHGYVPNMGDTAAIFNNLVTVNIPAGYQAHVERLMLNGNLDIIASATLNIEGDPTDLFLYGLEMNTGTILNNGTINFTNLNKGIYASPGVITNNGILNLSDLSQAIYINESTNGPGALTNNGMIIINDCDEGVNGENIINNNSGSIIINNPIISGMDIAEISSNYGTIQISGNGTALGIKGPINNQPEGKIIIENTDIGMESEGENNGLITVKNISSIGMLIKDSWTNNITGSVTLSDCNLGIAIENGEIDNFGTLNIQEISGSGIDASGKFTNKATGNISLNNLSGKGIHIHPGHYLYAFLDNQGEININNCDHNALHIEGGHFENFEDATLSIDDLVSSNGIFIETGSYPVLGTQIDPYFSNAGLISFGNNINGLDLVLNSTGSITNENCSGMIEFSHGISINGTFTNYGFIDQNYNGSNQVAGNIINYGIINDVHSSFAGLNINNQSLYFSMIPGHQTINSTINANWGTPYMSSNHQVASQWFLDPNLTQLGANYNVNNQELTLFPASVDYDSMFFEIKNENCPGSNMIDTVMIRFSQSIALDCGTITWNGGKSNWNNINNWNKLRLPEACDTVEIQNPVDSVIISMATPIVLSALKNNGTLFINSNANVEIEGATNIGLYNLGSLAINGHLRIKNAGTLGIYSKDAIITNSGFIEVENAGQHGLYLNNSTFNNNPSGQVKLTNSGDNNLHLTNNSIFELLGEMLSN